jgi:hypothetical protein
MVEAKARLAASAMITKVHPWSFAFEIYCLGWLFLKIEDENTKSRHPGLGMLLIWLSESVDIASGALEKS